MPVAVLKSMSDVVTRGLICGARPLGDKERDCHTEGGGDAGEIEQNTLKLIEIDDRR